MYWHKYNETMTEVHFPAGGIGTGCFSVGSRGQMSDFEFFGNPGKGNYFPYHFYAIYAKKEGEKPVSKVLEAKLQPPYTGSHGYAADKTAGLPRFDHAEMRVQYPVCEVKLEDEQMPVQVTMEVGNPMIPLDLRASSFPAVWIKYRVENPHAVPVDVTIAGSTQNMSAVSAYQRTEWESIEYADTVKNEFVDDGELRGYFFQTENIGREHRHYGNHALLTWEKDITCKNKWLNCGNWDGLNEFWQDFSTDGKLEPDPVYTAVNAGKERDYKISSLGICKTIAPKSSEEFHFLFSWYFPNRDGNWYHGEDRIATLHYTNYFDSALDAARKMYAEREYLEGTTKKFTGALYGSTLPEEVLDAVGANLSILRSPTCFILKDGTFLSWEGCFKTSGCCEGNCTHVYNYAQTVAFLYPELEKSMERTSFLLETGEDGEMAFRTQQVFGNEKSTYHPAVDGQMGTLIRLYRDWKLTGDDLFLREVWEQAKKALDFAFTYWDSDGDGVLDSQQHNTYDIEFYHPNSLANTMFLGALKAAAEMAEYLGDQKAKEKYEQAFETCALKIEKMLWGGEYYIQSIEDVDEYVYQYGTGCLSDQILGQTLSTMAGLGYILPEEHVKEAVKSVYRYNFKEMDAHACVQRTYALSGEKGLVLCSWPHGGRPKVPFIYSDEVWAGVEYTVAVQLIYEGMLDEALELVRATRARYDGRKRDPFCEVECGNYYVRSMASWGLIPALSGYKYDLVNKQISFSPKYQPEHFQCFFSNGKGWGIYHQEQEGDERKSYLEVLFGDLEGVELVQ